MTTLLNTKQHPGPVGYADACYASVEEFKECFVRTWEPGDEIPTDVDAMEYAGNHEGIPLYKKVGRVLVGEEILHKLNRK